MMYLIVPPIIIILAIAILIVFLARVLMTEKKGGKKGRKQMLRGKSVKNNKKVKKSDHFQKGKDLLREKSEVAAKKIKNTLEGMDVVNSGDGASKGNNNEKIVLLRKKSMVSDKMKDGEDRDMEELAFMKKIENDPQNSKKYESLADYYMEHEKFEDARECYKYVLRLDPRHKRAQVAMKNLYRIL